MLVEHPWINTSLTPDSEGAVEQDGLQNAVNDLHTGNPAYDTADFADAYGPAPDYGGAPGNLRADYVLPKRTLPIVDAGVFWPTMDDPLFRLVGVFPFPSSDHRLVWIDLGMQGQAGK